MSDATQQRPQATIYTDGACHGNPGPGGWAAIIDIAGERQEISGGFARTTNNRMELLAVIEALERLEGSHQVRLTTDSRYLHDALTKGWLKRWRANGWKTASKSPVKNQDLWKRLLPLVEKHQLQVIWTRGHDGHPENERCDLLAGQAAQSPSLTEDKGYREQG
jgi:ribonuclease HI